MEIKSFENMEYRDNEICIDDTSINYVQTNDCTEEEGAQTITISSRNNGVRRFVNIKTGPEGWSINDVDDLIQIINDFKQRALLNE